MSLRLRSPAKINLFLHIHAKRNDGYHDLSSLIQAVSLFDYLTVSFQDSDKFLCSIPELQGNHNLVIRARDLFRQKTGWMQPVMIALEKHIPMEAGLGGGSGNAATILWGLNQLSGLAVPESELQQWSAELGSDIPFYFSHGTAYCEGRGELVTNLSSDTMSEVTLVKPDVSLKTPAVFQEFRPTSIDPSRSQILLKQFQEGNPQYENDLEKAAFSLKPELISTKSELSSQASNVSMSGSGSSFFCIGHHQFRSGIQSWPVLFHNRQIGEWY